MGSCFGKNKNMNNSIEDLKEEVEEGSHNEKTPKTETKKPLIVASDAPKEKCITNKNTSNKSVAWGAFIVATGNLHLPKYEEEVEENKWPTWNESRKINNPWPNWNSERKLDNEWPKWNTS